MGHGSWFFTFLLQKNYFLGNLSLYILQCNITNDSYAWLFSSLFLKFSHFFPKKLKYYQYLIYFFLFLEKFVVLKFFPCWFSYDGYFSFFFLLIHLNLVFMVKAIIYWICILGVESRFAVSHMLPNVFSHYSQRLK